MNRRGNQCRESGRKAAILERTRTPDEPESTVPSRDSAPRARAVEAAVSRHRPECIVIMPMYAGFEDVRASVAAAVDRAGFEMRRLEEEIAGQTSRFDKRCEKPRTGS